MKNQVLLIYVIAGLIIPNLAFSGPIADRLDSFVGKPAGEVRKAFGQPRLESPNSMAYSFNSNLDPGLPPSGPNGRAPADIVVDNNGRIAGVAPATNHPSPNLPCSLKFEIDDAGQIASVEHSGPGCFEIVYSRTIPE